MDKEKEYFRQKTPSKYEKVVYKEESDSEPEVEEKESVPGETEEEIEKPKIEKKNPAQRRKNNIFEYLNNNAKRNKQ